MRGLSGGRLVLASHNAGKLREIAALLEPYAVEVVSVGELGLPVPEETETSFAGNARLKARAACDGAGLPALSDDSGLAVDALGGAPGVYTADWAETGAGRDFAMAMDRLEREVLATAVAPPWRARFVSALCVAWPDGDEVLVEGEVWGTLAFPRRGDRGFGFDPVFVADGHSKTFGEMEPDQKHGISHRAVAFAKLLAALDAR